MRGRRNSTSNNSNSNDDDHDMERSKSDDGADVNNSNGQNNSRNRDDRDAVVGPEELVRRETNAVMVLRATVIAVLIIVGALLSFGTYKLVRNSEEQTYARDFEAVSTRFTDSFKNVITQSMWSAYSTSVAITSNDALANAAPNIVIPDFVNLNKGTIQTFRLPHVFWAPLIQDEQEKKEWEAYAQKPIEEMMGATAKEPCNVCGNETLAVTATTTEVELPIGTYTCAQIEWAGQVGVISKADCPFVAPFILKNCACLPIAKSSSTSQSGSSTTTTTNVTTAKNVSRQIINYDPSNPVPVEGNGPYLPVWQVSPSSYWSDYAMRDLFTDKLYRGAIQAMIRTQSTTISQMTSNNPTSSFMFAPVFTSDTAGVGTTTKRLIGSIALLIVWDSFLGEAVPLGSHGVHVVLENSCGQKRTFQSKGDMLKMVGFGDLHDPSFSTQMKQTSFEEYVASQSWSSPYFNRKSSPLNCAYRITVYSSNEYRSKYITNKPRMYALAVILIFVFTCTVFVAYDCYVARRQRKVMTAALQRDEIVASLFPDAVRGRLLKRSQTERRRVTRVKPWDKLVRNSSGHQQHSSQCTSSDDESCPANHPAFSQGGSIADYFPCVTVVFADISGFTAWSSDHEPSQVFHLLETVYHGFDKLARRYGVFKIETIGDCYVAVAGLPEYQPDHAVRVVKFAHQCIVQMNDMLLELEATLGLRTSTLSIRIGIHSGPVIAGVLRGEKSRFQLFGDTMNTTSRVQTTGEINKIQLSTATAELLQEAQKSHWIDRRHDLVAMKGKGLVQTYWIDFEQVANDLGRLEGSISSRDFLPPKRRESRISTKCKDVVAITEMTDYECDVEVDDMIEAHTNMLMKFVEEIGFGNDVRRESAANESPGNPIMIHTRSQLRSFISAFSSAYHNLPMISQQPYHNFEHCMFVAGIAADIIRHVFCQNEPVGSHAERRSRPPKPEEEKSPLPSSNELMNLQRSVQTTIAPDVLYDPVLYFAVVLSAMILDLQNFKSRRPILGGASHSASDFSAVSAIKAHSCRESLEFAWSLLENVQFHDILSCICREIPSEKIRLYRVLEILVGATDDDGNANNYPIIQSDGVATQSKNCNIPGDVFDGAGIDEQTMMLAKSVLQASLVGHGMRDWTTYQTWCERSFQERYVAVHQAGSIDHPIVEDGWYYGEVKFLEEHVIPLAEELNKYCRSRWNGDDKSWSKSLVTCANGNRQKFASVGQDIFRQAALVVCKQPLPLCEENWSGTKEAAERI